MKYIYSNSLDCMVIRQFIYKRHTWVWNDTDCVYYRSDTDEYWLYEVPLLAQY